MRTPVMAVAATLPFAGEHVGVMAEHFATIADAYRVIGVLPEGADQHPTADGRGKSGAESRDRLARMIEVCTGLMPEISDGPPLDPFVFRVRLTIPKGSDVDPAFVEDLIRTHKPAHAGYILEIRS